jgi:1-phosphofructokinase
MSTLQQLKVVTVTLNPALDLTGNLPTLNKGAVNNVNHCSLQPAGKGVNVAKVLAELGADVTVTGFLGLENEAVFAQLFEQLKIEDCFIRIEGATRINVKLVEDNNQVSDINFPGPSVSDAAALAFENMLFKLALTHDVFVIAGSLPKGISPEMCANWIAQLQQRGKQVLFDSSNAALRAGLAVSPWLVKPNNDELSQWAGRELTTEREFCEAGEQLAASGIANVVVSLGEKGVLWLDKHGWSRAVPPTMNVVSTVGAGDTLVAGMCWGHLNGWNKAQTVRFATALSALAVAQTGVGVMDVNAVVAMSDGIAVSEF